MKMILFTASMALLCMASAGSASFGYESTEAERLQAITSILRGGQDAREGSGLLSDISVISNLIGGRKNRIDAANSFGGDFSGSSKRASFRSFVDDGIFGNCREEEISLIDAVTDLITPHYREVSSEVKRDMLEGSFSGSNGVLGGGNFRGQSEFSLVDAVRSLVTPHREYDNNNFAGLNKRGVLSELGRDYSADKDSIVDALRNIIAPQNNNYAPAVKRSITNAQAFAILRDLNVISNLIGGEDNRIGAVNGYKGIGSGAF